MSAKVELSINGAWTDVTDPDVWVDNRGIEISRGRPDERGLVSHGQCGLTLDNSDGQYSDRNPLSPYYGQLGRNTPIRVGVDPMSDTFTRSVVDGMGTSSSGHVWSIAAGAASNWDVNGSAAVVDPPGLGQIAVAVLPNRYGDVDVLVKFRFSTLTGTPSAGIVLNWQDSLHYYLVEAQTITGGLGLYRFNGSGSAAAIGAATFSMSSGVDYWLRARVNTAVLQAKVWADGDPEPGTWLISGRPDATQSGIPALTTGGKVGLYGWEGSGTITFDSLTVDSYRFHGEVSEWPVRPSANSNEVATIPVVASGPLRRLSQNAPVLQSPMYREAMKDSVRQFVAAYWPCEDMGDATRFAAAIPGVAPLLLYDTGSFGQTSTIPGSKAMGVLGSDGSLHGLVPNTVDTTGKVYFRIVLDVPTSPTTPDGTNILNIYCAGSSAARFGLNYLTASAGALEMQAVDENQTVLESASLGGGLNGTRLYLSIELVQSGGNIAFLGGRNTISADNASVSSSVFTDTWVGLTAGRMFAWSAGTMDGWGFCHVGVGNDQSFMFSMAEALIGSSGETAGNRMIRLAAQSSIPLQMVGDPDDTAVMGPQIQGSALDVLRSCEAADMGILYESRNEFGLSYRTKASLYNQAGPAFDYNHLTGVDPTDDDQALANDITVQRINGSSARAELTDGKLSTQAPPDGAGRYIDNPSAVGVQFDSQLDDIANWRLHLGTWDEVRLRSVSGMLSSAPWTSDPDLTAQVLALDCGDRFTIGNPPVWLGAGQVTQLVQGYRETLARDHADSVEVDWNTAPAAPWTVAEADGDPRVDTDGSEANTFQAAFVPLNGNTTFETAVSPWTAVGGTVTQSRTYAFDGEASLLLTPDGVSVTPEARTENVPGITPGQVLTVQAWVRCAVSRTVNATLIWRNSGGGIISTDTLTHSVNAGEWTLIYEQATAPALTTQAQFSVSLGSTPPASHLLWIDEAWLGTATPLLVSPRSPATGLWVTGDMVTDPTDFPLDIVCTGERMRVTGISGASSPQTFTVVRAVNGINKNHGVGAAVNVAEPAYAAL